jgi:oligoribonuclease NrnB/cAMP/cGMP phosphodiesterase (DHH superfamily)
VKCFYHRQDFDGQCSGAIIKSLWEDCEMVGINYGDNFPWDTIDPNEIIWMVDFSLPRDEMKRLIDSCYELEWIDHHDTAIKEMEGLDISGIRRNGTGACELVWEYIYPHTPVPVGVHLLAMYDVWDHTDSRTLPFQAAMKLEDVTHPDSKVWFSVFESEPKWVSIMGVIGQIALRKETKEHKAYVKAYGFPVTFEGYKAIAVNRGMVSSSIFDSLKEDYDLKITFAWHKSRHWKITLYSDKDYVHCGEIAKKYGGGGHRGAAGYHAYQFPFVFLGE